MVTRGNFRPDALRVMRGNCRSRHSWMASRDAAREMRRRGRDACSGWPALAVHRSSWSLLFNGVSTAGVLQSQRGVAGVHQRVRIRGPAMISVAHRRAKPIARLASGIMPGNRIIARRRGACPARCTAPTIRTRPGAIPSTHRVHTQMQARVSSFRRTCWIAACIVALIFIGLVVWIAQNQMERRRDAELSGRAIQEFIQYQHGHDARLPTDAARQQSILQACYRGLYLHEAPVTAWRIIGSKPATLDAQRISILAQLSAEQVEGKGTLVCEIDAQSHAVFQRALMQLDVESLI